jgi:DNA polymerase-3 subunit epsilon
VPGAPAAGAAPGRLQLAPLPIRLALAPFLAPPRLVAQRSSAPLALAIRALRGQAPGTAPEDVALSSLEYVVVDVETTGGSAARGHRVTEIALLRVAHDGRVLEEFTTLVNPERPIPPFISSLTNITWDMVRDAPRFREIAHEVERMLEGRVFVAHNASFDWRFISWELERATGVPPEGRVLCTVRLARKVVPEIASRSLDSLAYFFGLQNDARHRAYGDARVTAALLGRLMGRLDDQEVASWAQLEFILGRRKPRRPRRGRATPTSMDPSEIPSQ